jgi:hypothetical protein
MVFRRYASCRPHLSLVTDFSYTIRLVASGLLNAKPDSVSRIMNEKNDQKQGREDATMKVFVAGATGAIGKPLIAELVRESSRRLASAHALQRKIREYGLDDPLHQAPRSRELQ